MRQIVEHIKYYFLLLIIFCVSFGLIMYFSPNRYLQMLTLLCMAILYVVLGIFHHLKNHNFVFKIMVEYVLIAALGLAAMFFLFRGGFGF